MARTRHRCPGPRCTAPGWPSPAQSHSAVGNGQAAACGAPLLSSPHQRGLLPCRASLPSSARSAALPHRTACAAVGGLGVFARLVSALAPHGALEIIVGARYCRSMAAPLTICKGGTRKATAATIPTPVKATGGKISPAEPGKPSDFGCGKSSYL